MTYNEIFEHLYDLNLDCLSENEFDDYKDEVADKAWTLSSTNRHVEQVSSSDEEEISFDQNIPVLQPSTVLRQDQFKHKKQYLCRKRILVLQCNGAKLMKEVI